MVSLLRGTYDWIVALDVLLMGRPFFSESNVSRGQTDVDRLMLRKLGFEDGTFIPEKLKADAGWCVRSALLEEHWQVFSCMDLAPYHALIQKGDALSPVERRQRFEDLFRSYAESLTLSPSAVVHEINQGNREFPAKNYIHTAIRDLEVLERAVGYGKSSVLEAEQRVKQFLTAPFRQGMAVALGVRSTACEDAPV